MYMPSKHHFNSSIKNYFHMNVIAIYTHTSPTLFITLTVLNVLYVCVCACMSMCLCLGRQGGPKKNICNGANPN